MKISLRSSAIQVHIEGCKQELNLAPPIYLITKATTKYFKYYIFLFIIKRHRNNHTNTCAQNHGSKPMVLCMPQEKPCAQKPCVQAHGFVHVRSMDRPIKTLV